MYRDVSSWEYIGPGGKSTLEKEELLSPEEEKFLMKYKRNAQEGVTWEDITEYIAAKIGEIYGLQMMTVEMATRSDRTGCLMRNFIEEHGANMAEEGGALLQFVEGYNEIREPVVGGKALIAKGFQFIETFDYWSIMKQDFINMLVFDTLIGNQDRHPFNWSLLFYNDKVVFSPIYDNGASLGFRFDDEKLMNMTQDSAELEKYTRKATLKAGLFENKKVNAKQVIMYLKDHYQDGLNIAVKKLLDFDLKSYNDYISNNEYLSDAQKEWLKRIIPFRREKILQWIEEE
ncbi:HipA domain-containing protein [Ectobacillus funiculus]|uniref:HipA domain-containing protein n=1 Tax=Ectobacillus funiculus TaxID=137993 RepID=UPI00397AFFE7